nr:unnamed protein product [Callosobruchus analis]
MDFFIGLAPNVIKMPVTAAELNENAAEFYKISGFPGIIGCIDGTSIQIRIPKKKIKSTYTNRHDVPSITLKGICDHRRRFIDVSTGAPGKVHDARVFKISDVSAKLPNICDDRFHTLGDNAYPIRTYLSTPYKDFGNLTLRHINYNKKLSACRVLIENTFGILKGRFRQLQQIDIL